MESTHLVHFFDTAAHRTLCGLGYDHRSTKHPRGVTCADCVKLLAERRTEAGESPAASEPADSLPA